MQPFKTRHGSITQGDIRTHCRLVAEQVLASDHQERRAIDIDRSPMSYEAPEKPSAGVWAWIAIAALAGLYAAWRWL
jgi:hypothetical protein